MEDSVLTFKSSKTGWNKAYESLKGTHPQCISFDSSNANRAYCGTFGSGLWKTDDGGESWDNIGKEIISSKDVMSVSVSHLEREGSHRFNTVYVGTEPTAIYTSDDGGESWQKMSSLNNLKSSSSWSFPPRPWTSHVRWIEPDKTKPGYVHAAIEAGALVQSHDGGKTWIDKVEGGPYDTHTLATHKKMPGQLYSAAGDGYFESYDYGQTWKRLVAGLDDYNYLLGLAVDSGDPKTVVVSASQGAYQAHSREDPKSLVCVRTSSTDDANNNSDKEWKVVKGLPEPRGTIISILAANPKVAEEFYAINNRGIFCSIDLGSSWKMLDGLQWPKGYLSQHPFALAVREDKA
jgi:BNR/Asp-box repeat protein